MGSHGCERIGHGGASALAPANTLESFEAALAVGIDMVEFDVRPWRGELVLAHTLLDAWRGSGIRLQDALSHLALPRFGDVALNVDVKNIGCEQALIDAIADARLLQRTLLSSQVPAVLDGLRARDPGVRLGISVGGRIARLSRRWSDWRAQVLAGITTRRWDALMAQHRLIDEALLADVIDRDGRLYAWTVNDRAVIESLTSLGVHGITTADPRLFTQGM